MPTLTINDIETGMMFRSLSPVFRGDKIVKYLRFFRPQFPKVKTSFSLKFDKHQIP